MMIVAALLGLAGTDSTRTDSSVVTQVNQTAVSMAGLPIRQSAQDFSADRPGRTKSPKYSRVAYPYANRISVLAGMSQIVYGGANLEVTYYTNRLSFDYSHGVSLDFEGNRASSQVKEQGLAVHMPWTTGFGVGYRVTPFLDVRVEPKLHSYEIYYAGQAQTSANRIASYRTATLGLGAYYRIYPFSKLNNGLSGIVVAPSVRYWPNIWSSLNGDSFTYVNKVTGKEQTHKAETQGINGTNGLLVNVSIGYTFGKYRK